MDIRTLIPSAGAAKAASESRRKIRCQQNEKLHTGGMLRISLTCLVATLTVAPLRAASVFEEDFAVPGSYADGQDPADGKDRMAGAAAKPDAEAMDRRAFAPAKGEKARWQRDQALPGQEPGAFVVRKPPVLDPADAAKEAKAVREARARKREEEKDQIKNFPKEDQRKKEDAMQRVDAGIKAFERLRLAPGHLELVAGQKGNQSMHVDLPKPLKPPFYVGLVINPDPEAGHPLAFSLEDATGKACATVKLAYSDTRQFKVNDSGTLYCQAIDGPLLMIIGVEQGKDKDDSWQVKVAVQPGDPGNPFMKPAALATSKLDAKPEDFARFKITTGGKAKGSIDEIRIGTSGRDVLP